MLYNREEKNHKIRKLEGTFEVIQAGSLVISSQGPSDRVLFPVPSVLQRSWLQRAPDSRGCSLQAPPPCCGLSPDDMMWGRKCHFRSVLDLSPTTDLIHCCPQWRPREPSCPEAFREIPRCTWSFSACHVFKVCVEPQNLDHLPARLFLSEIT